MQIDELLLHPRSQWLFEHYTGSLPNGLVIDGPSGVGVATVAKALAKSVGSPLFIIEPKKKVKNEWTVDYQEGSIIIDDIRQLYEQTRTRQPGQQVFIIDTGEKSMTIPAQNAFLKLLEEPRAGVHFIVAIHQPDQLLPTIMSRSQQFTLLPITDEQTAALIQSLRITDDTKRARLAFVGHGRPALIRRLADDDTLYEARIKIMADAKTLLGSQMDEKFAIIHRYRDNRSSAVTLLDDMNHQLQTIIRKQPDPRIAAEIDKHLKTRARITAGGNIRLQLAADIL